MIVYPTNASVLTGAVLLVMLICLWFGVRHVFKDDDVAGGGWFWKRRSTLFAWSAVLFAWWVIHTDGQRDANSAGRKTLDNLLDAWAIGEKAKVVKALDTLSAEIRPWDESEPEPVDDF